jgi:LacI family transcriptional regulator
MHHPNRASIRDVAEAAGVSIATVSRVLNTPSKVGAKIRGAVEAAIARLGYIPNAAGRALSSQRSRSIGVVIPTIDNAIFARGMVALFSHLAEREFFVVMSTSFYRPELEARQAVNLIRHGVDGLLLLGRSQQPSLLETLRKSGIPFVRTGFYDPEDSDPCVGFDNRRAAAQAASFLVQLGHRQLAMVAGLTRDNDRATDRVAGVRAALKAAGSVLPSKWLLEREYTINAGRQALRELWRSPERPTAVLCGNDVLAFGVLLEAQHMNIDVPRHLSVLGFDDLELATHLKPSLTTMRVDVEDMWRRAADLVLGLLEGRDVPQQQEIEVRLVVRDSTAPPRADEPRALRRR